MIGGWDVWVVEVLPPVLFRRIATAATIPTTLQAVTAFATAGQAAAKASRNTPDDGEYEQAQHYDYCNHWPFAVRCLHAIIPAGKCQFDV